MRDKQAPKRQELLPEADPSLVREALTPRDEPEALLRPR